MLDVVDWASIAKGHAEAWLYFYEDFLEVYDNSLRKLTGSYYTPAEVVQTMVRLCDEALRSSKRFAVPRAGRIQRQNCRPRDRIWHVPVGRVANDRR